MSDEWRILGPEEMIHEGDEHKCAICNDWHKSISFIGSTTREMTVRRRVSPEKDVTEETDEDGRPICKKCRRCYYVEIDHEPADYCHDCVYAVLDEQKQRAEKAERIVESLEHSVKVLNNLASATGTQLHQAEKERDQLRAENERLQKHRDEAEGLLFDKDQENEKLRAENAGLREVCQNLLGKALESPELGRGWSAVPDEVFEQAKAALAAKGETK